MKHEIGHALNLLHEHQRVDRGAYITIKWNNIDPNERNKFRLLNNIVNSSSTAYGSVSFSHGPFDKNSIMIYDPDAYSINGQPTIVDRYSGLPFYKSGYISPGDVDAVEYMKSGRVDDEALLLSPYNVRATYPLGKHEGDMFVTWDPVPGATKYHIFTLHTNNEFILYRTVYGTSYHRELKDSQLSIYRVRVCAANEYGGYSMAIEADYNWK